MNLQKDNRGPNIRSTSRQKTFFLSSSLQSIARTSALIATMTFYIALRPSGAEAGSGSKGSFAAIYYSLKDDYIAWSDSWETKKRAENEALNQCRKEASDCELATWFSEGCGSVAVGGKIVAWGWDDTAVGAIQAALARCTADGGKNCINKGSHCA